MKKLLGLALMTTLLISCGGKKTETTENTAATQDNAHTSLDYQGVYLGVLPCADCDSITVTLTLADEAAYTKVSDWYKNGGVVSHDENTGTYSWNTEGNTITLSNEKNAPNQYFVAENALIQLDMDGNKITGPLADKYILTKK